MKIFTGMAIALVAAVFLSAAVMGAERSRPKEGATLKPLVLVINYPYQITGSGRTKIHACLFKPDFVPAAGAAVTVNGKPVGKADRHGVCIFDYVPGSGGSHVLEGVLAEGGTTYRVTKSFSSNGRTESFRSDQLYVYTDRGVYNPGDAILIRLIAWELLDDYKAIDGAEATLLLQSGDGRVFSGAKVKTNDFGVGALRLPVPDNLPEGNYELVVLYHKAREVARLQVRRFVPPVMNIRHNLKRYLTPSERALDVKVDLSYFAGGAPKSSTLGLAILDGEGKELLRREMEVKSPASFDSTIGTKELDAVRRQLQLEKPFRVVLTARDSYRQQSSVTRDMVYTARPFLAVLELDKDDYPPGESVQLLVKVLDLDGKPARAVELACAVSEFAVSLKGTTDDQGVAVFTFPMGKTPATAVVTSPIMAAPLGTAAVRLNEPKPMVSKVSEPPKRQGIETRFTVTFDDAYIPVEKVVHVDFTDISGGLVASGEIPIRRSKGKYLAEGTVKAPTWGTMLVNLYCCAIEKKLKEKGKTPCVETVGFVTEGQHVTLYPDCEASITVRNLRPRVRPGEEVTFEVDVRTKSGQESSLGAALVDRSVVSLLDPFEVTPKDRFYNPQLKVISTGGSAVLTWPVVDRNWGEPWRDIAYTSWGFKAPGPMVSERGRGQKDEEDGLGAGGTGASSTAAPAPPPPSGPMKKPSLAAKGEPCQSEAADLCEQPAGHAGNAPERRRAGSAEEPAKPKVITIRTRFPETALWEPLLKTKGGTCIVRATFPDSITVQRLTLVASDKRGGLGLLHQDIDVRQDLFVRADTPATMTLGDTVRVVGLVKNSSGKPCTARVTLESSQLAVVDGLTREVALADGEEKPAEWNVRAGRCGKCSFTVTVEGADFRDSESRSVFVLPAGSPRVHVEKADLAAEKPYAGEVVLDAAATYRTVSLNVSFPDIVPALQAWDALNGEGIHGIGVYGLAGRALLDGAFHEWAAGQERLKDKAAAARERMSVIAAALVSCQGADGGWGWFSRADASREGAAFMPDIYLTSYVLRALLEISRADILVDGKVFARGFDYLMKCRNKSGLWAFAYFWETPSPEAMEADWALSADVFDTLVRVSRHLGTEPGKELAAVERMIHRRLTKENPMEPAFVAKAVQSLLHWAQWRGDASLKKEASSCVDSLLALKRRGHWEPHWYHAYGGMVELNAAILELLTELDREGHEGTIRELVTFLLSTREAWGAWHNEIGTATAVRALMTAGAGARAEIPSTVTVAVNGREAAKVCIDPSDPFLSAVSLRSLDLTPFVAPGKNAVEVKYDGRLTAPLRLEVREWGVAPDAAQRSGLTLARRCPEAAALGEPVDVELTVEAAEPAALLTLVDAVPSNMAVDEPSVQALVKSGTIAEYAIDDAHLRLTLAKVSGKAALTYRLKAVRVGTAGHGGLRAASALGGEPAVLTGGAITVTE